MLKSDESNWFVAQLRPQGLKRALEHLQRQGFETFAPVVLTNAKGASVARQTQKPLFPGYLFIKFDPEHPGWSAINSTRGIARLILNDPRQPIEDLRMLLRQFCYPLQFH